MEEAVEAVEAVEVDEEPAGDGTLGAAVTGEAAEVLEAAAVAVPTPTTAVMIAAAVTDGRRARPRQNRHHRRRNPQRPPLRLPLRRIPTRRRAAEVRAISLARRTPRRRSRDLPNRPSSRTDRCLRLISGTFRILRRKRAGPMRPRRHCPQHRQGRERTHLLPAPARPVARIRTMVVLQGRRPALPWAL